MRKRAPQKYNAESLFLLRGNKTKYIIQNLFQNKIYCHLFFRYLALTKPLLYFQYRRRLSLYAKRGIFIIWILSFLLGLITSFQIIPNDRFKVYPMGMTLSKQMSDLYIYQVMIIISAIFLWSIYAKIYYALKEHIALIKDRRRTTNEKRFMLIILKAMITAFSICFLPLAFLQSFHNHPLLSLKNIRQFSPAFNVAWNFGMYIASRLVVLNSLLNCVIYNYKNKYLVFEIGKLKQFFFGNNNKNITRKTPENDDTKQGTQKTTVFITNAP